LAIRKNRGKIPEQIILPLMEAMSAAIDVGCEYQKIS
jgi:hypothetical protein